VPQLDELDRELVQVRQVVALRSHSAACIGTRRGRGVPRPRDPASFARTAARYSVHGLLAGANAPG
jgi:hypothetical protein